MREWKIKMPYIGGILTDNSYKNSKRGTRPVVKWWMRVLELETKTLGIPLLGCYVIDVFGEFKNESRPDIPNLFKVISDSIERGLGVNDKYFRVRDAGYSVGHLKQQIIITIRGEDGSC